MNLNKSKTSLPLNSETKNGVDGLVYFSKFQAIDVFDKLFALSNEINVEPNKADVEVNGSGPYLWINN
jgi:hypothetical protein